MTNVTRENYGDSNSDITKNIYKKYGLTNIDFANNYYLCSVKGQKRSLRLSTQYKF